MQDPINQVYADSAASTPINSQVLAAMMPYLTGEYGDPSSLHHWGKRSRMAIEEARSFVASILNALPEEVVFTSGDTESDNLAIRGSAFGYRSKGRHLITSAIEHQSVLSTFQQLEKSFGFAVSYLRVDRYGRVDPQNVEHSIRDDTILISISYGHGEIGTIQPISEIGRISRARNIIFHSDAAQCAEYLPLDVDSLDVDLLSFGAHKLNGPKGVGVLYSRRGIDLLPTQTGEKQEQGKRAGSENVAGIVGLAAALRLAREKREENAERLNRLRDYLVRSVLETIPSAYLTGHPRQRLPGHASFCFDGIDAQMLVLGLDMKNIGASAGAACMSGMNAPSYVLEAMGVPPERARGALRISLSLDSSENQVDYLMTILPGIVEKVRKIYNPK
jgi:cysteine desulfurase